MTNSETTAESERRLVRVRFMSSEVLVATEVDPVEHARRRAVGVGPLVSYEILTRLWELPAGGRVVLTDPESERFEDLRRRWPGMVESTDGSWCRLYHPGARVVAVFADIGSPSDRVRAAAQFVRFARRYAVGVDLGGAAAGTRRLAERWGVGSVREGDLTVRTESSPPVRRRPSVWDWLFAEVAYQECWNRSDQAFS